MKYIKILCGAALAGGTLATAALASSTNSVAEYRDHYRLAGPEVPLPALIVAPTDLPSRYEGAIVTLSMTIDTAGSPQNISVVSSQDPALVKAVTKAVAQWRFTPALRHGVPVATKVLLPLRLS